jgi:hypothetical protein
VGEIDAAGTVLQFGNRHVRQLDSVKRFAPGDEIAFLVGVFDRPRFAAVEASAQAMLFGPFAVDVVALVTEVFEIPAAESDEDFVAPDPDAVVRRPSAEPAFLVVHLHVLVHGL